MAKGRFSFDHVVDKYGVPARRGMRVTHHGRPGTITCGDGAHIRVRFDGERHSSSCHPLSIDYLDGVSPEDRLARHNARIEAWNERLNGRITDEEYRERMAASRSESPNA